MNLVRYRATKIQRIMRASSAFVFWCALAIHALAASSLSGRLIDPDGGGVPGAAIHLLRLVDSLPNETLTDGEGGFFFGNLSAGEYQLIAEFPGFVSITRTFDLADDLEHMEKIQFTAFSWQSESVTVTADVNDTNIFVPDPSERVFVHQDLLENSGRPGAPVSIPGYPIETASSGIKAPQYFAPGVAGDHGEPIAQFIAVGGYLLPNNLSANAHGNGYADPNIFVPQTLETVQIDGGAFNVREGNHSVNLAATYGLRSHLDPFFTIAGDHRDIDLTGGWSPDPESWLAIETSYGNGFLHRLEHGQQYKFSGERVFNTRAHRLTLVGLGYYGQSYIPGLVPIFAADMNDANLPTQGDTIDPRQKDQTHTVLLSLNDVWQLSGSQQLQLSDFFRTYNLSLYSDFGQGLIRQSEFRTVGGGSAEYVKKFADYLSLLIGSDYQREAPRHDDLDRYPFFYPSRPSYYGTFGPIGANDVTIESISPYIAAEGGLSRHLRYYFGWRQDDISLSDRDLLVPQNSFRKLVAVNSPKTTLSYLPGDSRFVPLIAISFGEAFFTEDPRIGLTRVSGTPVAKSRSYQIVASKTTRNTDIRLTVGHVSNSAELAKIDPDTGLQFNQGPSRLRFMTIAVRRDVAIGSLQASISKADARDLASGDPTPEAPRAILDLLGTIHKLPLHLQTKTEFEFVGRKPLGTGCDPKDLRAECVGTVVKEFRGALFRQFLSGRLEAGLNFLTARGYTGQTTENFYPSNIQKVVGVRLPSYASLSFTYRFGTSH
jgi:hypothetical protein